MGRKLAFVVQRYGPQVTGGSESLARAVAERLVASGDDVTVLTTTAVDYVTWRNELPAGEETIGGVRVRRFPVREQRDLAAFNAFAEPLYARATTRAEELAFLERQGPVAPALLDEIRSRRDAFDVLVFFTYLYWPTVQGLLAAGPRSVLVPTTHDEPPLRFSVFEDLFSAAGGLVFLTPPEADLVHARFDVGHKPQAIAGIGIDPAPAVDVDRFRRAHAITRPWVLCAGRIDAGKGCADMVDHYRRWRARHPDGPDLLLAGTLAMELPADASVRYLGFLTEEDKAAAMAGARALVCPSPYESLSIVLLEAFELGTPALVNGRSAVLQDHAVRSNAALWYEDAEEFGGALDRLLDPSLRDAMTAAGRRYVDANYRWGVVLGRYREVLDAVSARA
jgi:glycosyltransferase involved in cell wall biosynthesis